MKPLLGFFVLFLVNFRENFVDARGAVTNEDIRDAILQVVNVVRATDDKLERHEFRDRSVGEQIKKGLVVLERKIKVLEPLRGSFQRLDERVASVESYLLKQDSEKEKTQKILEIVENLNQYLPMVLEKMKNEIMERISSSEPPAQITEPTVSKKDFQKMEKDLSEKVDKVSKVINGMEQELGKIREDREGLEKISNKSTESLEQVKKQLSNSEQMLEKYDSKLNEINNRIPMIDVRADYGNEKEKWEEKFLYELNAQKSQVNQILNDLNTVSRHLSSLPNRSDVENVQNSTLSKIEELKHTTNMMSSRPNQNLGLENVLQDIKTSIEKNSQELSKNMEGVNEVTSSFGNGVSKQYDQISKDIQALSKLDKVMMQTADSVLDTKRRVEYGVHQIIAKMEKQVNESGKEISQAMAERFDSFEFSIIDEDNGAIANYTTKISEEIQQVWRQIGIMHQQMTASTVTLNELKSQTDTYVNGTTLIIDNVKGKVGKITGKMSEVDDNLNYLLGRLALVTQEFNNIKIGLGDALDQIKGSFSAVQNKLKDNGPGPHNITSNEVDV